MKFWSSALMVLVLAQLGTSPVFADFKVTVTKTPSFTDTELVRVAVVTSECHQAVDCTAIQRRVIEEVRALIPGLRIVPDRVVRERLLGMGATKYSDEHRSELIEALELSGLFELKVPFAMKGDGFAGKESSQAKVELLVLNDQGGILAHGVGTGRPNNVVSSPERVASNIVKRIVKDLYR